MKSLGWFLFVAHLLPNVSSIFIPPITYNPSTQKPLRTYTSKFTSYLSDPGLDGWLEREEQIAVQRLIANLAPIGRNAEDAAPGAVIASPSRGQPGQPNYYYQWVRDGSITASTIVDLYRDDPSSDLSSDLVTFLDAFTTISHRLQHTDNPSGSFDNLKGLGEPKFMADGSPYTESWGRPQRDGPALRAITLMQYLRAYNETHPEVWSSMEGEDWFDRLYYPSMPANSTIKADLEYVSHSWRESGFDLWEEVQGKHFFTAMVQLRALQEGAELARLFGDKGAAKWYQKQADKLKGFMHLFWDDTKGHLVETLTSDRSGLDCGLLLGAIHGTGKHSSPYPPHSDEVLVSLLGLVNDQRDRFPINSSPGNQRTKNASEELHGVGVGRYPEDVYDGISTDGGNPWFLCTCTVAETLYRTSSYLTSSASLNISNTSLPFYRALLPRHRDDLQLGVANEIVYNAAVKRLKEIGDEFLDVVKIHTDAEGALSEQFDAVTGFERGARDLTWSYGAFLQAVRARKRLLA
ncbi:glucoamylase I precursor [Rhizodiscina lignyota]|uniref:glucan 1,4-alpha-glucosidase n=1 Tax=Rhizodiscina lignyota TaxID=1504668 RepID=A0A9P4MDF9_9PEZI|nr:glucoamylase I precursor [Rhizodiscina lignyota]